MGAPLRLTVLLALLLSGCAAPAPSDYWTFADPAGQARGASPKFEALMASGTRANLAGRPAEAEDLFRRALSEAESARRAHPGGDTGPLSLALMSLASQLSASGQFERAEARFAEAGQWLAVSSDGPLRARLTHYLGVHALNQGQFVDAAARLKAAGAAYTALLPDEVRERAPVPSASRNAFDVNRGVRAARAGDVRLVNDDPRLRPVLLGLIEVLRYSAVAARALNHLEDADALTGAAARLAAANGLDRPSVFARVYRTAGTTAASGAKSDLSIAQLGLSDRAFAAALPGTRPAGEAGLILAGELMAAGRPGEALPVCRRAVKILIAVGSGTSPDLMAPCLEAYAARGPATAAEMFLAAQVAQSTIVSRQIARASAFLAASTQDKTIGAALRRRDDSQREADRLYRALDTIGAGATGRAGDRAEALRIEAGRQQATLTAADAEVRRLAPGYGQLVQDVVPASAVFAMLRPDEGFVGVFLSRNSGWVFALRNGAVDARRIAGGAAAVAPLVRAVRAGIEKTQAAALPVFDIAAARALYDLVLGPVAASIQGAASLAIAPSGPLLSLPFEVLLTGPADPARLAEAPFLMRRTTIAHVPAPANFVTLRGVANTSAARKPWFGFGDSQPVSLAQAVASFPAGACGDSARKLAGLAPLPGAARELEIVRASFGATAADELLGASFTADRVLRARDSLRDYRILHFAAHALLPSDLRCESEAAIVTSAPPGAPDAAGALLTASRLLGLDLDAVLVILSACDSGGPGDGGGESLSGLARSFFYAHARSLMVSHWDVDDRIGALLVALTVDALKTHPGLGAAGALRDAQLDLLDRVAAGKVPSVIAHPFFWAPFAVIGEGGAISRRTGNSL